MTPGSKERRSHPTVLKLAFRLQAEGCHECDAARIRATEDAPGTTVTNFRESFRHAIDDVTAKLTTPPVVQKSTHRDVVVLRTHNANGFEVRLECFDFGVNRFAGGWSGETWYVTGFTPEELAKSLVEFISSVSNDAVLIVHYSNGNPYKWVLNQRSEGRNVSSETISPFFNWFGKRSQREFCNKH